jgi:hypothetical protein
MKRLAFGIFALLLCSSTIAQKKDNQIGLRIGEPMGISFKRTLSSKKYAVEFILGTASSRVSSRYYKDAYDDLVEDYQYFSYQSHKVSDILYLQARFVRQKHISWDEVPGSFHWYYGGGIVFKSADVKYTFKEKFFPFEYDSDKYHDIDFGPEGIVGIEYTFKDVPVSVYTEFDLLIEMADQMGYIRPFTGIGVRFNF